ncbi:MAG: sulfatase-like hydrolase/transferase [Oscillospiraceae bacterium]
MKNDWILKKTCVLGGLASSFFGMAQDRPNVIVIMTDEHNFRTLGCYREQLSRDQAFPWGENVNVETPHIDKLAHQGALCLNYYAAHPVSGPSRSCFMTGMYPQATGVYQNDVPMKKEMVTFASTLLRQGYATGYFGKWHLDGAAKPGWAPKRQFGFSDNRYMYNRGHWKILSDSTGEPKVIGFNQKGQPAENVIDNATQESFSTDFFTNRALRFIESNQNRSFCCFLSIADPHGPNLVREPYSKMYTEMKIKHPLSAKTNVENMPQWAKKSKKTIIDAGIQNGISQYFGMVKCIDDNVGKILSRLQELDLNKKTIIIFTADHGDLLGEHNKDNKSVPYEGSAKVPFIWFYPNKIPEGNLVREAMNNTDFTPTLLGLMEINSQVDYQGMDYSKAIMGERKYPNSITVFKGAEWIAATDGRYKLIYSTGPQEVPVLFDLAKDPDETTNIYQRKNNKKNIEKLSLFLKNYCITCKEPLWENKKIRNEISCFLKQTEI